MGWRDRLLLTGVESGYLLALTKPWRAFARAAASPWKTQADLLSSFLHRHADSAYGRAHRFDEIRSVSSFQDEVPICGFEEMRPWVERIAKGETNVLGPDPVRVLERSSGSTGGNKLIPYTERFLAEISRATGPWIYDMYRRRPWLLGTTSYWSISPAAREKETTEGGIPIGFQDDTEYFGPLARWALSRTMAVPGSVARAEDVASWRTLTARHLLRGADDLGFISVWSPSFLTLLMETIESELDALLETVGRSNALRARIDRHGVNGPALFPKLRLISCWTDGPAARLVPEMAARFPGVEIEGKGLLATEGVVSFPIDRGRVAAVNSHFLEFQDLAHPDRRPRLLDQLQVGDRYAPILTTGNGFARYRLPDEVECTGFFARTPLLRFIGKLDRVSDVCGEKLTAAEVDRALARAGDFVFALLAPADTRPPRYELYLEGAAEPEKAARSVEVELMQNHHYAYCRDLGQLGPVMAVPITDGWRKFERAMIELGTKAGDVKPTPLDARPIWGEALR